MPGRSIRFSVIFILVIGLLAGSAVGVAAQEEPVEVTGTRAEGSCGGFSDGTFVCKSTLSMSDARLDGIFTYVWNLDDHVLDSGELVVGHASGRLENADGAWQLRPYQIVNFPGLSGDDTTVTEMLVLDGEGSFEGLVAVVEELEMEDGVDIVPSRLHGYIIDGEFPEPPEVPADE